MVESDSDTEKVKISEHNFSQGGSQGSVFPREPSFSGWCDEDGAIRTDGQLETVNQSLEDFRFELPLLPQVDLGKRHLDGQRERNQQKRMQVNGGNNEDGASAHGLRNANGKRLPFDIENGSGKDQNIPNSVHTGFNSVDNHGTSESKNKSLISAVDVLKTLSFILVWYIFSTSLTLYNKNLLGDDLGKFPAPLLMNTVHFGMQALLSNAITWFWSQRFKPSVSMSWKDYFLRDGLCLSQLYQLLWEQRWI